MSALAKLFWISDMGALAQPPDESRLVAPNATDVKRPEMESTVAVPLKVGVSAKAGLKETAPTVIRSVARIAGAAIGNFFLA
jgi:hypothetical protein